MNHSASVFFCHVTNRHCNEQRQQKRQIRPRQDTDATVVAQTSGVQHLSSQFVCANVRDCPSAHLVHHDVCGQGRRAQSRAIADAQLWLVVSVACDMCSCLEPGEAQVCAWSSDLWVSHAILIRQAVRNNFNLLLQRSVQSICPS